MRIVAALLFMLSLSAFGQDYKVDLTWVNSPATTPACPTPFTTNLYRAVTTGGQTTPYKTGLAGASYSDTTTLDGLSYFYKVSNSCAWPTGAKEGPMGAEVKAVIPSGPANPAPAAPTGLTATPNSLGAQLNWNAIPNVNAYHIFTSSPAKMQWHIEATTTKPTFLDKSATVSGKSYKWFVSASNTQGESDPSLVATVVPK